MCCFLFKNMGKIFFGGLFIVFVIYFYFRYFLMLGGEDIGLSFFVVEFIIWVIFIVFDEFVFVIYFIFSLIGVVIFVVLLYVDVDIRV